MKVRFEWGRMPLSERRQRRLMRRASRPLRGVILNFDGFVSVADAMAAREELLAIGVPAKVSTPATGPLLLVRRTDRGRAEPIVNRYMIE